MIENHFQANIDEVQRKTFADLGLWRVKETAPNWTGSLQLQAYAWIREQEEQQRIEKVELEARFDASQSEQVKLARISKNAAIWAAVAAVVSIPISIIAVLIAVTSWHYPSSR